MRKSTFLFIFILISCIVEAQWDSISARRIFDSLNFALKNTKEDTSRVLIIEQLGDYSNTLDETLQFYQQALSLSQKIKYYNGEARITNTIGNIYWNISNYPQALGHYLQSLKVSEEINYQEGVLNSLASIGNVYLSLGSFRKSLDYSFKSMFIGEAMHIEDLSFELSTISKAYSELNMLDSALLFAKKGYEIALKNKNEFYITLSLQGLGDIFIKKNNTSESLYYYRKALSHSRNIIFDLGTSGIIQSIAEVYQKTRQADSSIYYSKEALRIAQPAKATSIVVRAATLLSKIYEYADEHESLHYLKIATDAKDSIFNNEKNNQLQNFVYNEELRQKDKESVELQYRNNLKFYGLFGGLAVIGVIAIILYRNNKLRKKANSILKNQKEELQNTLRELKSTQAQLIQSEKMASLGELTAGIAHEIQNPLNFVNNFSEVNRELIEELKEEAKSGHNNEVVAIADDISANEEKIIHHGKRADAIVKGMLQHSRSSTGVKEPTNINALADEYLRLSYHGLRAKDKEFNAVMNTNLDEAIGTINIVPQDIGRVLLNLYNNAFYAVNEKRKQQPEGYEPIVSVSSKKIGDNVTLTVKDNGNGIPQKVLDKIFQPFFTTKPTGEGTGLGLSLAYDIITKEHNGTIKVESNEGEGSIFIIQLPILA